MVQTVLSYDRQENLVRALIVGITVVTKLEAVYIDDVRAAQALEEAGPFELAATAIKGCYGKPAGQVAFQGDETGSDFWRIGR